MCHRLVLSQAWKLGDEPVRRRPSLSEEAPSGPGRSRAWIDRHRSLRLVVVENSPNYAALVGRMLVEGFSPGIGSCALTVSRVQVSVEITAGAAGAHDQLIFSLVRELVSNAERRAAARQVAIRIQREGRKLAVEVQDDGTGLPPGRLETASSEGHIGLASSAERVEALVAASPSGRS